MRISDWSSDVCSSDLQGVADVNIHLAGVTLGGGAANDIAGRAVIVHAAPDDYTSQPSGNAGARVACGIITPAMCRVGWSWERLKPLPQDRRRSIELGRASCRARVGQ